LCGGLENLIVEVVEKGGRREVKQEEIGRGESDYGNSGAVRNLCGATD
jgi:hypothetical protein